MWFGYHPEITARFPQISSAVIWVNSYSTSDDGPGINEFLAEAERLTRERCPERSKIARQESIAAWRETYSRMGLKPNRYPCATEQLMRRVVDGHDLPRITPIVDLGNAVSLKYMIPVAPFDLARIDGRCEVRFAEGCERFWPINSDAPDEIPEGEVIFGDESPDVISRRWAWRQSDKVKVTPETAQLVIVAEAMHESGRATVASAGTELADQLRTRLNADVRLDILDAATARSER